MQGRYSMRSPAVKRLMKEAQELREPTEQYHAQPLEDNLFEWHFTIRGPEDSEFEGGIYHGRIVLPPEYPMKPPSIIILTPNGRFEVNKKICLSISGHHPESWQPSWSIRTALLAIIGFMPTHGAGAIGSLDYTKEERLKLAKRSQDWDCPSCGKLHNLLKPVTEESHKTNEEAKQLAQQIIFQAEKKTEERKPEPHTGNPDPQTTQDLTAGTTFASVAQARPFVPPSMPSGSMPFQNSFVFPMPQSSSQSLYVPRFPPPPPVLPMMFPGFPQIPASYAVQNRNSVMNDSSFPAPNTSVSESGNSSASENGSREARPPSSTTTPPGSGSVSSANQQTGAQRNPSYSSQNVDVRQRRAQQSAPADNNFQREQTRTSQGRAVQPETQPAANGRWSLVLMCLLSFAIAVLLLRRFILSRSWKYYYGI